KSTDGRALPRTYVRQVFVDACKADQAAVAPPDDKLTVREAAALLDLSEQGIHSLIRYGVLDAEDGNAVCKTGYSRPGKVLSRAEVEKYKRQRAGEVKPEPFTDPNDKLTYLPRPLALDPQRFPHITAAALLHCTNKHHPTYGNLLVRAKPIEWPNGFRFP